MSATPPPVPLSRDEEAVMRAIARLMLVLPRMLDADLVHDQRMPMSEYATLRTLSEAPGRIMRMSELATACFMSLSGMTRLAAKLESVGYLARLPCESDGRGFNAVLTDAGLARLQEAWPSHLASVRRRIFDHLGDVDLPQFAAVLTAMTAPVGPACDSAGCDA